MFLRCLVIKNMYIYIRKETVTELLLLSTYSSYIKINYN